jgi:hypothetical protein
MDRRLVQQKKGLLTDAEVQKLVTEWQDVRGEAELNQATINREVKTMEEKLNKYNMATLGEVPTQREDGSFWILVCQMGGCSWKEVRELKIAASERLINKYKVNLSAFIELNYNWATVDSSANLASWFCHKEREIRLAVHAEKKYRKILQPDSNYSPTVQMWYNRIHAYLQLIQMKEGKTKNVDNIIRFTVRTNIQDPDKLTMEELKDGLRYCRI